MLNMDDKKYIIYKYYFLQVFQCQNHSHCQIISYTLNIIVSMYIEYTYMFSFFHKKELYM